MVESKTCKGEKYSCPVCGILIDADIKECPGCGLKFRDTTKVKDLKHIENEEDRELLLKLIKWKKPSKRKVKKGRTERRERKTKGVSDTFKNASQSYIKNYIKYYREHIEGERLEISPPPFYQKYPFTATGYILPNKSFCLIYKKSPSMQIQILEATSFDIVKERIRNHDLDYFTGYFPFEGLTDYDANYNAKNDAKHDIWLTKRDWELKTNKVSDYANKSEVIRFREYEQKLKELENYKKSKREEVPIKITPTGAPRGVPEELEDFIFRMNERHYQLEEKVRQMNARTAIELKEMRVRQQAQKILIESMRKVRNIAIIIAIIAILLTILLNQFVLEKLISLFGG